MIDRNLKLFRVYDFNGTLVMVIIVNKNWSTEQLNKLMQNGMRVTVVDQRSDLVNKLVVD